MKHVFYLWCVIFWIASWFIDIRMFGYNLTSEFWTRFTYMFSHEKLFHLALNLLAIDMLLVTLKRITGINMLLSVALFGAFLASFGSEMELPTIGASGVMYFLLGYYFARRWHPGLLVLLCVILAGNALSGLFFNANIHAHAYGAMYGFLYGAITRVIKEYNLIRDKSWEKETETGRSQGSPATVK